MVLYLSAFVAAVAAFNGLANPYGAWPVSMIDPIYHRGGEGRVGTPYRLRIEHPTIVLVGSSRVMIGMRIEQGSRDGVLNAGLPAAKLDEVVAVVEVALENPNLKRLVWGVDFFDFSQRVAGVFDPDTRLRLEGSRRLMVADTLLSMDALDLSRELVVRAARGRRKLPAARLMPIPWTEAAIRQEIDKPGRTSLDRADGVERDGQLAHWIEVYSRYRLSDRQIALFKRAVAETRRSGVELVCFVPPMSGYELEAIRQTGLWDVFQHWKRELAAIVPYRDFSGYNEIALNDRLFADVGHYKPASGFAILRLLLGEDCSRCGETARMVRDSGLWVEPATIDRVLATQDERRAAFVRHNSRWSEIVEDVRRRSVSAESATAKAHRNEPASASDRTGSQMPAILRGR